jgi:hypothetical protein
VAFSEVHLARNCDPFWQKYRLEGRLKRQMQTLFMSPSNHVSGEKRSPADAKTSKFKE